MKYTHPIHDFHYQKGELFCEQVSVASIAKKVGTPVYIYSYQTIVDHYQKIKKAFSAINPIICFAMKANSNMAILKALVDQGAGFDIVSLGELKKAQKVRAEMKKIVFASVGKTDEEIEQAIKAKILLFNVESLPELRNIQRIALRMKRKVQVALRINPDMDAPTHEKINTGSLQKKFGVDLATAKKIFLNQKEFSHLQINAIHVHIGSQITEGKPFLKAFQKALLFIDDLKQKGVSIDYFNIGGGMGIVYKDEDPQTAQDYARLILPLLKGREFQVIMEPGRFLVGNAGIFVTKKLYLKNNGVKNFMIVDAGMNDLVRPSMYDAYHEIIPVKKTSRKKILTDVVGPICESSDVFAHNRKVSFVEDGEFLALLSAGAYGYVMASNYNVRLKPVEVLVKGKQWAVVQERQSFQDLMKGEKIPAFLK